MCALRHNAAFFVTLYRQSVIALIIYTQNELTRNGIEQWIEVVPRNWKAFIHSIRDSFFSCCCYRICFLLWRALTIASPWQWNSEFSVSAFVMNRRKPAFRASKWIVNMFVFGLVWYGLLWFGWVDSNRFWTFDIELISINCIQAILPFRHFNAYPQARINNQNRLNLELLCHNATKSHFINQPFIFLANVHVFGTHSFSIDHGYRSARKRYTLKCRIRHFNAFNDKNAIHIFVFCF